MTHGTKFILLATAMTAAMFFGLAHCAKAGELPVIRFQAVPPVVPGIRPDASGQDYERQPPHVRFRPGARAYELSSPAQANRCGPHAF